MYIYMYTHNIHRFTHPPLPEAVATPEVAAAGGRPGVPVRAYDMIEYNMI